MKSIRWIATAGTFLLSVASAASVAHAAEQPFGIATGERKGTYFAIGQDISDLSDKNGLQLEVLESGGSLENMYQVYKAPEAQLGIVQHDVLFWIRSREGSDTAQRMAEKIKLIFPLYSEEVHIVARNGAGIEQFEDLDGKIVAIGSERSGTSVTAGVLFDLTGVRPAEIVNDDSAAALDGLKRGDIDAMIYVAGAPVRLFVDDIAPDDDLHFVPIENKVISEIYGGPQVLDASNYRWAKDGVTTVAVKAVLVTYNYQRNREKCDYVGAIADLVRDELDELQAFGHPKWQSVDLDAKVAGWETSSCTEQGQGRARATDDDGFKTFLEDMAQDLN